MEKLYYNAGIRIRQLREKKHYTREMLAEQADISTKFLYEIEVGDKGFSAETLYKLSEALGVPADYILKGITVDEKGKIIKESNKRDELIKILERIYQLFEN